MHTSKTILASALATVVLAACGTSPDAAPNGSDTAPPAASATTDGSATEPATTDRVDIDTFAYKPAAITVTAGTTVTWTNRDNTKHTVTAGSERDPSEDQFDEDVEASGDTITVTFDEPGTYDYFCVLHPFMTGTVTVTE